MANDNNKKIGLDFTEGPVMPLLIRFFLPFLLANILNSLYNTIDTIVIGQFVGSTGIVAVTMGGKMLNMFSIIGNAFAGGAQTLMSQLKGGGEKERISKAIGTIFSFMIILSAGVAVLLICLARPVLKLLNTPDVSFDGAMQYLIITCIGLPLMFGYNAVSSVLRGMGDSKSPLIFIAVAAVFNLIGDIIFIVVFHLGAAGTAIATVMGQGISLIFSVILLYKRRASFGFDFKPKSFKLDRQIMKIITKLGLPMALRGLFISVTQLVLMGFVNSYGVVEAAAYSIGDKIYHLTNIFVMAVNQAGAGMIGQNIGADKRERVPKIMRATLVVSMSFAVILAALSLIFPRQIFSLFTQEAGVLEYAKQFMAIAAFIYIICSIMGVYDGVVTGTGAAMLSFLGGFLDGVLFRVCFSLLFAYVFNWGIAGFFMGEALARFGPIIVGAVYYHSGAWKNKKKLIES